MGIKTGSRWALSWFSSTILDDIQFQVIFFTAFSAMVVCVSEFTGRNLGIQPTMITVVGTVVSLVVSFKTNSAYSRWWEGRNLWASLTSSSRHIAMLIWLHIPNVKPDPPASSDPKDKKKSRSKRRKRKGMDSEEKGVVKGRRRGRARHIPRVEQYGDASDPDGIGGVTDSRAPSPGSILSPSHKMTAIAPTSGQVDSAFVQHNTANREHVETLVKDAALDTDPNGQIPQPSDEKVGRNRFVTLEPLREASTAPSTSGRSGKGYQGKRAGTHGTAQSRKSTASTTFSKLVRKEKKEDDDKMREKLAGMLEKKTYIGLVQAFGVAMKHALRGESGPFYSDLFHLISFLPKYNTSVVPPVTRDDLLVPWVNGIPRQKELYNDDSIVVPLTAPAPFTGYAFETPTEHDAHSSALARRLSASRPRSNTISKSQPDSTPLPGVYPPHLDSLTPSSADPERSAATHANSTTSPAFRASALQSATSYLRFGSESHHHAFTRLDKHHRVMRKSSDVRDGKAHITTVELMPPRHPPIAQWWDFFPPARLIKIVIDWVRKRERVQQQERVRGGRRKRGGGVRSEIPHEVLMYISAYISHQVQSGRINNNFVSPIMTSLFELQKCLTDLEKIASTPIPSAYSFHLRLTVWAYLLFLPFQIYPLLGWITIPAVAIAAITYLGFLEIGCQIEMPFVSRDCIADDMYDHSDLDLDKFTLKIARQLAEVTAFPTSIPPEKIILSTLNTPLLPSLSHTVPELLGKAAAKPRATGLGFAASYESDSEAEHEGSDGKGKGEKSRYRKDKNSESDSEHDGCSSTSDSSEDDGDESTGRSGTDDDSSSTLSSSSSARQHAETTKKDQKPLPKTVRDVERALVANWHHVSGESEAFIGKPRQQLENRTGMDVAVIAL